MRIPRRLLPPNGNVRLRLAGERPKQLLRKLMLISQQDLWKPWLHVCFMCNAS